MSTKKTPALRKTLTLRKTPALRKTPILRNKKERIVRVGMAYYSDTSPLTGKEALLRLSPQNEVIDVLPVV